ncbi:IclR family transcriptional regulator [Halococcus thailandensis]|uniref:Transcriptional regulator n=1 Tax=Halococcus thailandensis JCM 13552 TaxID=1227457 RepID=M0N177_9EURY|nr:IclR family transcriptional regulator [Halococcus thailandensis]EMA51596.1 transcriptional regulator [Halococcus thailandensis JCM 13552]
MHEVANPVTTVETAFEIVEYVAEHDGAGVSEIATDLDRAKSTIHRHLGTLVQRGYLVEDGGYSLGLRFLDLGLDARDGRPLYHEAHAKVDELAERTGEKVWCMTAENGRSIHLHGASGTQSVRTNSREGDVGYLHQHAAGKAILAHRSPEHVGDIVERYGLPTRTDDTITDGDELFDHLERIRERGYAFNREESVPGLYAVGAPITDDRGVAIGALSISGPANRLAGETLTEEFPELLLGAVNEIEINLSHG